jgi:hypothetical protein
MIKSLFLTLAVALVACKSNEKSSSLQNSGQMIDNEEVSSSVQLNFAGGVRCSGTVVGSNAIMTAAHCLANVNSGETQVTLLYRDTEKEPFISRVFLVEELTSKTDLISAVGAANAYFSKKSSKHEGFSANEYPLNKTVGGHDIAIIEFDKKEFHHTASMSIAKERPVEMVSNSTRWYLFVHRHLFPAAQRQWHVTRRHRWRSHHS